MISCFVEMAGHENEEDDVPGGARVGCAMVDGLIEN